MNETMYAAKPLSVVVFTGRFGMGHCAAAEAVRQEILAGEPSARVQVVDVMDYLFPEASRRIYEAFGFLVKRCSWVYNLLNRAAGVKMNAPLQGAVAKKLDALLEGVDLVIAALPLCSQYVSAYKRTRGSRIPLYTYITDVTIHQEWIAAGTDLYFVGAESSRDALAARGVDPGKIVISGIPVKQCFKLPRRDEPHTGKRVLIMGGGLGLIPEADALLETLSLRDDLRVTLIAGHNKALAQRVRERFPAVETVGYTDRVSEYMRRADLVITKSGGITTFEAIHSETPLYILRPFLMQEVGNARHIERLGIGWVNWQRGILATCNDVTALLNDDTLLATMRRNMRAVKERWQCSSPLPYFRAVPALCG